MKLWLKNPLSVLAENAGGGIVVEGTGTVSYTHLTLPTILLV